MVLMKDVTTISITKETKKKLGELGQFGQTFDDIVSDLIKKGVR